MKKQQLLLFSTLALMLIASALFVKKLTTNHNTRISVSENTMAVYVIAEYPESKTASVEKYLQQQFNLTNASNIALQNYPSPDGNMRFDIKSFPGYVKLAVNKEKSNAQGIKKMRSTAEGIKEALKY